MKFSVVRDSKFSIYCIQIRLSQNRFYACTEYWQTEIIDWKSNGCIIQDTTYFAFSSSYCFNRLLPTFRYDLYIVAKRIPIIGNLMVDEMHCLTYGFKFCQKTKTFLLEVIAIKYVQFQICHKQNNWNVLAVKSTRRDAFTRSHLLRIFAQFLCLHNQFQIVNNIKLKVKIIINL